MKDSERLNTLGKSVVSLGEFAMATEGELGVLTVAVLALVASHPKPDVFRAEFQRFWLQSGSLLARAQDVAETHVPIHESLSRLEAALGQPLGVRPPQG
jgi:hypothetical protein